MCGRRLRTRCYGESAQALNRTGVVGRANLCQRSWFRFGTGEIQHLCTEAAVWHCALNHGMLLVKSKHHSSHRGCGAKEALREAHHHCFGGARDAASAGASTRPLAADAHATT